MPQIDTNAAVRAEWWVHVDAWGMAEAVNIRLSWQACLQTIPELHQNHRISHLPGILRNRCQIAKILTINQILRRTQPTLKTD